jgi:hypothetical protein
MASDAEGTPPRQPAYVQKRRQNRGVTQIPLRIYLVTYGDGSTVVERCIGLSQVAAEHPHAQRVEWIGSTVGGFW